MKTKDLFSGFLDDCYRQGLSDKTVWFHQHYIKNAISAIAEKDFDDLLPIHMNLVVDRAKRLGKSGPRKALMTFRKIMKYARKCRIPLPFDIDEIVLPEYRRSKDPQALTIERIREIRDYLKKETLKDSKHVSEAAISSHRLSNARTLCLFEVLLHTGLRISEALALNVRDIDFETKELRIENCKEEGSWDTVYLHGATQSIHDYLKLRTDEHEALFVVSNGHETRRLTLNGAKSYIKKLRKRMDRPISHKIWRSTFITSLLRGGADIKQTQILARHKSLHTTADYYYAVEKEKMKPLHQRIMELI